MIDVASILNKPRKSRTARENGVMSLSGCDHEGATVNCGTCLRRSPHSLRKTLDVLFVMRHVWDITGFLNALSFVY